MSEEGRRRLKAPRRRAWQALSEPQGRGAAWTEERVTVNDDEPIEVGMGELRLGWQFAPGLADPGPPPARAAAPPADLLEPGWLAAQRRISVVLTRPVRAGVAAGGLLVGLAGSAWLAGLAGAAAAGTLALAATAAAAGCATSVARERRRLAVVIAGERRRVQAAEAARTRLLAARQREHAAEFRAWQRRKAVFDRQPSWFAVRPPAGIDRIDVAGGSLAGWAALLITLATASLSAGGEVSIVDLTEAAVAADLVGVAQRAGLRPLVWALPADLPRLDLGLDLDAAALADVLALAAGAAAAADRGGRPGEGAAADLASDCALLERVLAVLDPDPPIAAVTAALRALADVGDPRDEVRSELLTDEQQAKLRHVFRKGAIERIVLERAFVLESRLRRLDALGTGQAPGPAAARLRVAGLDRRGGVIGNRMIGTYLVAALTHLLRQSPPGEPWAHLICLLGAERLGGEVLDRLADACEAARTGLVLAFRSIPANVRERLGRGNAAVAFMRLGNGDDARAASELIGTEHRFVVSQLTDTVGTSLTDTWGDSYTSSSGTADSVADSVSIGSSAGRSRGSGRSRQGGFAGLAPFGDFNRSASRDASCSVNESESLSLTRGINTGTSWGISLSRALGENASLGRTAQRSREFLVEAAELQRLPPTAVIVSYPSQHGCAVVLADANPAIGSLPTVSQ